MVMEAKRCAPIIRRDNPLFECLDHHQGALKVAHRAARLMVTSFISSRTYFPRTRACALSSNVSYSAAAAAAGNRNDLGGDTHQVNAFAADASDAAAGSIGTAAINNRNRWAGTCDPQHFTVNHINLPAVRSST